MIIIIGREEVYIKYYSIFIVLKEEYYSQKSSSRYNLKKIGLHFEELQELNIDRKFLRNINQINHELKIKYTQISTLTNPSRSLEIIKYIENANRHAEKDNVKYYFYFYSQGFTVEEFKTYIKKLKKNSEPRPFSKDAPLVPYVHHTDYNDPEIEEAIQLFYRARLIKIIPPISPTGEIRYHISDNSLVGLITIIRLIQEFVYYKIFAKLAYIEKPDENDRQILELYHGKKATDIIFAKADQIRKNLTKRPYMQTKIKKIMQDYDDKIDMLKDISYSLYAGKFHTNDFLTDLLIGFPLNQLRTATR